MQVRTVVDPTIVAMLLEAFKDGFSEQTDPSSESALLDTATQMFRTVLAMETVPARRVLEAAINGEAQVTFWQ